ncbi:hypothetical protein ACWDA9_29415 [Streptomyces sp. NPDC001193]
MGTISSLRPAGWAWHERPADGQVWVKLRQRVEGESHQVVQKMTDVTGPLDPWLHPCHLEVRRLMLGGCAEGLIIHSLSHISEVTEDYAMSITDLLIRARLRSSVPARIEASFERTGQLDQDAHRAGQARRIARAWLHLWGASDLVDPAVSALSEVVTNAFVHGQGDMVTVRLTLPVTFTPGG